MGKLVVTEFISVDGVVEDPGGAEGFEHGGWSMQFNRGEEGDAFKTEELMASDAQLLGRTTYQGFAQAWPSMAEMGGFAARMNTMPKYVVSTTLTDAEATWENSKVIRGDLSEQVSSVKAAFPGDVLVAGSATLVRALAERDLVDEYRLMVFPLVLGSGKRVFAEGTRMTRLRLVDTKPVGPDGVVVLTYQPQR
ncbi:MAG: dihydrofolate reductase family protein [Candidatus Dormiibacterota bacterium]